MKSRVEWTSGLAFRAHQGDQVIPLGASPEPGGQGAGASPKGLLLSGLGGCTGIDVVATLAKMRVALVGFEVEVEADQTEDHPRVFRGIHLRYRFKGRNLPLEKLQRAVALSLDKYCGVSAMLAKAAPITFEIVLEEE